MVGPRVNGTTGSNAAIRSQNSEAAVQLDAANVIVPDELTARELVDLYLAVPEDLRKALRIYAASKLIPDANIMSNAEKIAHANIIKSQLKASLAHLDEEQANDVCCMLMKAAVHQLDMKKFKRRRQRDRGGHGRWLETQ